MPSTPLYDRTGKTVGDVELSDVLFAAPVNAAVLHQVVDVAVHDELRRLAAEITAAQIFGPAGEGRVDGQCRHGDAHLCRNRDESKALWRESPLSGGARLHGPRRRAIARAWMAAAK